MVSFISFVLLIITRLLHNNIFVFPYHSHTNKQLASLAESYITQWFQLFYKIPITLYCEHLQHFVKEICGSYFMSLPKSRCLDCWKELQLDSSYQWKQYCTVKPGKNTGLYIRNLFFFFELTSLPGTQKIFILTFFITIL